MNDQTLGRRDFIKRRSRPAGAAAATAATAAFVREARRRSKTGAMPACRGLYVFSISREAAFVEALCRSHGPRR